MWLGGPQKIFEFSFQETGLFSKRLFCILIKLNYASNFSTFFMSAYSMRGH